MLTTLKRGLYTLCDVLVPLAVLGFVLPPPHGYNKNAPHPGQEDER
jgi:hypothetical protein